MAANPTKNATPRPASPLGFWARLALALRCFRRLGDEPACASRIRSALEQDGEGGRLLPAAEPEEEIETIKAKGESEAASANDEATHMEPLAKYHGPSVNYLLGLLQRQARLVDFAKQDIAGFADDDIGAAARVVHEGLGRALKELGRIEPAVTGMEGEPFAVTEDYDPRSIKLIGEQLQEPPCVGTLRHAGWRMELAELPVPLPTHDPSVLAQAEVELGGA